MAKNPGRSEKPSFQISALPLINSVIFEQSFCLYASTSPSIKWGNNNTNLLWQIMCVCVSLSTY
jgi:hypothetical protein